MEKQAVVVILIAVAAIFFGLYNVFIKLSSEHINPILGAVVLQFVAAFLGLGLLIITRARAAGPLVVTGRGVTLAVLAGLAIGLVEILTFNVFGRGVPVALGNPLIVGGSLVVTSLVGILLLREVLTPAQVVALILIASGVVLMGVGART